MWVIVCVIPGCRNADRQTQRTSGAGHTVGKSTPSTGLVASGARFSPNAKNRHGDQREWMRERGWPGISMGKIGVVYELHFDPYQRASFVTLRTVRRPTHDKAAVADHPQQ